MVFANLDEIVVHVNATTLAALHARVAPIPHAHSTPQDAIAELAHSYLEFAEQQTNLWRCIFEHRLPSGTPVPIWFLERVGRMFDVVAQPIAQLRPDLANRELRTAARAFWSAVHGVCILGLDGKLDLADRIPITEVLTTLVHIYVAGLPHLSK